MTTSDYAWTRFLVPRDGRLTLADDGFLADPEGLFGRAANADLQRLEDVMGFPCLVLLGERGIGKSRTLKALAASEPGPERSAVVDIGGVASDEALEAKLKRNPDYVAWKGCGGKLFLYLDSLDECFVRAGSLKRNILELIGDLPNDTLRLRIACRTGHWPATLETGLEGALKSPPGIFEIAPLRRKDVLLAATTERLDGGSFIAAVEVAHAAPFAANPVTLSMLLGLFRTQGRLPSAPWDIYERGCRELCREVDERIETEAAGELGVEQRIDLAGRIAAMMLLSGRMVFAQAGSSRLDPAADLSVADLARGAMSLGGGPIVQISETFIRELAGSGLFTSRGQGLLGWAQQAHAQFLCARYLLSSGIPTTQMLRLLRSTDPDHARRVVPQLRGVAAWLASQKREFFEAFVESDPEVLLTLGGDSVPPERKDALALSYLTHVEKRLVNPVRPTIRPRFDGLVHPGIGAALGAVIRDRTRAPLTRRTAVEMALAAKAEELVDVVLPIATDPSEDRYLRHEAIELVAGLGSPEERAVLVPLLNLGREDDPDDEFRGLALWTVWPSLISARELFAALVPPNRPNFYGRYKSFLRNQPIRTLAVNDVPIALEWAARVLRSEEASPLLQLVGPIATIAWRASDDAAVSQSLVDFLTMQFQGHLLISGQRIGKEVAEAVEEDPERRQKIAFHLLRTLEPRHWWKLVASEPPLLRPSDLRELLALARDSKGTDRRTAIVGLISRVLDPSLSDHVDALLETGESIPELSETILWTFGPVPLKSDTATAMRAQWESSENQRTTAPVLPRSTPQDIVSRLMNERERLGAEATFPAILDALAGAEGGGSSHGRLTFDLRALGIWRALPADLRREAECAAEAYLSAATTHQEVWLGRDSAPMSAWVALAALRLVATTDLATDQLWKKWAAVTVGLPYYPTEDSEALSELRRLALAKAREETRAAIRALLSDLGKVRAGYDFESRVGPIWDEWVTAEVVAVLKRPETGPATFQALLEALAAQMPVEAVALSRAMLTDSEPTGPLPAKEASCATILLSTEPAESWGLVWPRLVGAPASLEDVLLSAKRATFRGGKPFYQRLEARQVGEIYRWLVANTPYSGDVEHLGVFTPSRRDELQDLRDEVLRFLSSGGEVATLREFEAIRVEQPELAFLAYYAVDARERYLERSWIPAAPTELGELFASPARCLVRTGQELSDLILELCVDIQNALGGETPDVDALWNENAGGDLRPKSERALTNYLANRLRERLGRWGSVILHREVEIKGGLSGAEKTDIYVDAVGDAAVSGSKTVSLVIEAKGCWHQELLSAMETQLVNGYMKTARQAHGLYAVFWFDPTCWEAQDRTRRMKTGAMTFAELREVLASQASDLARSGAQVRSFVFDGSVRRAGPALSERKALRRTGPRRGPTPAAASPSRSGRGSSPSSPSSSRGAGR
ncbi:MAG: hypothetical protein RBU36_00490 [Thermoanaerobaculia bacterium]|nr:hypothetical protein [Thermoanaerobaculia bacterium]